jgi:predicted N-formylglutamate amidohydrolase
VRIPKLVLSCEHGGARVPAPLAPRFRGARAALAGHRGSDPGALELARDLARRPDLARRLAAPLVATTVSRLVVDANRSLGHPRLFSEWTRALPEAERAALVDRVWRPHRARVEAAVRAAGRGPVLHVSVHSFTPRLKGVPRRTDVGLLYDPARWLERAAVDAWLASLGALAPQLRLRRNHPYRGTSDGLTTYLRTVFGDERYAGLELEVSQRLPLGPRREWARLRSAIARSLAAALDGVPVA